MKKEDVERFKCFMKPKADELKAKQQPKKKRIIGYTRVSSKQQTKGYSIEEQDKNIRDFAAKNGYELIDVLGGKYESAKGDFTRKEFTALYNQVIKMKPKPYGIAIKFISRFSRTGGGAISIVEDLINKEGVHLIETSTGKCTDDDDDRIEIYQKLLEANKENKIRLSRTLPGMKSHLEVGKWLGNTPIGYDVFGPRVTDGKRLRATQKVVVNEEGERLREAWKWKALGWTDTQIKKELKDRYQMDISLCRLGYIWKNPFYAGININKMLDEPVEGNWEALVTYEDFLKINHKEDPLKARKYNTEGKAEYPLAHFAICSKCGHILVGYPNKQKGIYYYKCKTCKKNYNADTLTHSRNKGLNDEFAEMLFSYSLEERFKAPMMDMMVETLCGNTNIEECIKSFDKQISDIESQEMALEKKYVFEGFPKDRYDVWAKQLNDEKARLEVEKNELIEKSSNSYEDAKNVVDFLCNVHKYWMLEDFDTKKNIQELVFPQGIFINPDNREVLTPVVNPIFIKKPCKSSNCEEGKEKSKDDLEPYSQQVAGMRIELMTSGL